jgi:GMP synthase (glutamine-hydrolysing)
MARILLYQIRERDDVAVQERACILERSGLREDQLVTHNLTEDDNPKVSAIDEVDGVLIGGAGVFSVTKDYAFTEPLADIVRSINDRAMPLLGICWGHQFIARALGGRVETDEDRAEVGTHEITLTTAGQQDPLFADLPTRFMTHMGHHDHVTQLPGGALELATSPRSPNQVLRLMGKPIYGLQFHIELNAARLVERLAIYQNIYMPEDGALSALQDNPEPTPEAESVLRRFIKLYI